MLHPLLRVLTLVSIFFLQSTNVCCGLEPWTRFRGPNGTGIAAAVNFPLKWTADDYAWRIELPGKGHASPVVWGEHVLVQSADEENANHHVLCFRSDGTLSWKKSFPATGYRIHKKNSFASASPAVDDDHAYVAWTTVDNANLAAFDKNGNIVWKKELGHYVARHGFGNSPMVFEGMVIMPCMQHNGIPQGQPGDDSMPETSFIVAFDCQTGEEVWRTSRLSSSSASYSVPCIYDGRGTPELVCCSTANGLFALDPQTGKENWSVDVFTMRTVSSPISAGRLVFGSTGSGGGGNYVVAVEPPKAHGDKGGEAYRVEQQAPYVPTPIVDGDLVYLWSDKGIVTCVEAPTGEKVWQHRVGGNYSGSPILVGDRLLCVSEDGEVVIVAAGRNYKLLGRNSLGGPSNSTPAVGHGRIYFRTYSHLIALGGA